MLLSHLSALHSVRCWTVVFNGIDGHSSRWRYICGAVSPMKRTTHIFQHNKVIIWLPVFDAVILNRLIYNNFLWNFHHLFFLCNCTKTVNILIRCCTTREVFPSISPRNRPSVISYQFAIVAQLVQLGFSRHVSFQRISPYYWSRVQSN